MKIIAYAPVKKSNGKPYTDNCSGLRFEQFRIYRTRSAADTNKVNEDDLIAKVIIEIEAK